MTKRTFMKFLAVLAVILAAAIIVPTALSRRKTPDQARDRVPGGTLSVTDTAPDNTSEPIRSPGITETGKNDYSPGIQNPSPSPDWADSHDDQDRPNPDAEPGEQDEPDDPNEPDEPDEPSGLPQFQPYSTEETAPDVMLASTAIMAGGQNTDAFRFEHLSDFGFGEDYSQLEGIITFRGNNLRDAPAYGRADIQNALFGEKWSVRTGDYMAPDGAYWSGHGWTGQPLIVNWPKQTREIMNMYEWAKEKEELVEIVYAAMDGNVYFAELETGEATRDKLYLGFPFKGSGALDPRGYPLLYVGAGYSGPRGSARILIVSLTDGSVLHTFGLGDAFAPRNWTAADASALVDAENDRLIYPSENGVLYIIDLNSDFDPEAGTMTIAPSEPVKWRYTGRRSQTGGKYWLGIESSPAIWRGYVFLSDNGGHLICLDLNTLEPVWVQDVLDDTNCTPVLELEDGHPYIYISTSFHGGWRASEGASAPVPFWKIDAVTGEIVWRTDYNCYTQSGVSGGVQATAALGKHDLGGLVYVPFARTPGRGSGVLAAFDKNTGEVVWEFQTAAYSWSSPVCVYNADGEGYIIYCTAGGYIYLLDGLTGETLDYFQLGGVIEASPAVYNSTIVVGTRAMRIWGVDLT